MKAPEHEGPFQGTARQRCLGELTSSGIHHRLIPLSDPGIRILRGAGIIGHHW